MKGECFGARDGEIRERRREEERPWWMRVGKGVGGHRAPPAAI